MKKNVLVNASSLSSGGALTILNKYINELFVEAEDDKIYHVFVPDTCTVKGKDNVHYIKNSENLYYKNRNHWNFKGMKKWCKANKVNPHEIFSMQNYYPFGFSNKKIFKRLYLHQSLPFFKYKWSLIKKEERILWFYKNIYYFLIKRSVQQSDEVITQTEWFKNQLVNKIKIDEKKVVVEKPTLNLINPDEHKPIANLKGKVKLFYPASDIVYKNHEVLYKAMDIIVNEYSIKDVVLYLTMNETNSITQHYINKFNLKDNVVFTGNLNYDQVMNYYKSVDVLVFPSKIETFGLPLIEAQYFNLPIIASDLELYHEVIGKYSGNVFYCGYNDGREWADSIRRLAK